MTFLSPRWRPLTPLCLCAATIVVTTVVTRGAALADEKPLGPRLGPLGQGEHHRSTANLDGHYLTIGPVAGAAFLENSWISFAGAEVSWMRVREHRIPAAFGIDVGAVSYGELPGGRLWAELQVAFDRPGPLAFGFSAGPTLEVDRVNPPHWGGQATFWIFAGVIPYLRAGTIEERGSFIELGLMIKLPVKIRY
jgi:hypothetical protein